jgi:DNA adenine methylase
MKVFVPPIKCQGIKTKLVPWIKSILADVKGQYIEPFMGSGVVGFNIRPQNAIFNDINPHIINFYNSIKSNEIIPNIARKFLEKEGSILKEKKDDHYYKIRERFNKDFEPLDFLFLSRSCFNGMIRFNRKGEFNVPFCHKPDRFSKSYITKIINQIDYVNKAIKYYDWSFINMTFSEVIKSASDSDLIYCDPPYIGRHVDYFNSWDEDDENRLFELLKNTESKFILSTWHSNKYRENSYFNSLWSQFNHTFKDHFYHVGAKETNRNSMKEALVYNFESDKYKSGESFYEKEVSEQLAFFEATKHYE